MLLIPAYAKWFTKKHLADVDAIPCFDRDVLCMASLISQFTESQSGVVCFAYSPWEMKPTNLENYRSGGRVFQFPCHLYDKILPDSQKAFMSPQVRGSHEAAYERSFEGSIVFPVPIFNPPAISSNSPARLRKGHIVSVGRLCRDMKQYNFTVLDDIRKLTDEGIDVTWNIYGDGDLTEKVEQRIHELGLQERVFLRGVLDYQQFASVVSEAHLFVGMGTAALEAAIMRVPTIIAHASTWEGTTHGFLQNQPFGIIGEVVKGQPIHKIYDFIKKVIQADDSEYAAIAEAYSMSAHQYTFDSLMEKFYDFMQKAAPIHSRHSQYYIYAFAIKLLEVTGFSRKSDDNFFNPKV
jgi:glycosyltransferase involved in cell wall biosynthesis